VLQVLAQSREPSILVTRDNSPRDRTWNLTDGEVAIVALIAEPVAQGAPAG
jgi:hypothetical protein